MRGHRIRFHSGESGVIMTGTVTDDPATDEPIDAVVTWVDGSDPAHRKKREKTLRMLGKTGPGSATIPAGTDPTRFTDNGEIRWCLHSIRKFAPWIRHIHLVTDNQVPAFLTHEKQKELGVRIVDHTEIFRGYEWALPTFNSYAIETVLWRINDLSDRFLFLNDDFVFINHTEVSDFFLANRPVLRGRWERIRGNSRIHMLGNQLANYFLKTVFKTSRTMQLYAQMNAVRLLGYKKRYYRSPHVPHPLRKDTFETFFSKHEDILKHNLRNRFRDTKDFVPVSLANQLEIDSSNAAFEEYPELSMISGQKLFGIKPQEAIELITNQRSKFICLQSFDDFDEKSRKIISEILDKYTGVL